MSQQRVVKYNLKDETFKVPMKVRKQLPIKNNIFELKQTPVRKFPAKQLNENSTLNDPLVMDSALIKSLVVQKIITYLIILSFIVSAVIVFLTQNKYIQNQEQQCLQEKEWHLLCLMTFISGLMIIIQIAGYRFEHSNRKIRGTASDSDFQKLFLKVVFLGLHPNIWHTEYNHLLHLLVVFKLLWVLSYCIKTSLYHGNRSFRLTEIYGIQPTDNFMFSVKSIVDEMTIQSIILSYIVTVFVFAYCLFVSGLYDGHFLNFSSCFSTMVVTLPTVGYGEYPVKGTVQRGIIIMAMIVGACFNSLITLKMLKQFEMSTQESNSYALLQKINLKTQMEDISRQYIISSINAIRSEGPDLNERKERDREFKEEYKFYKTRYNEISTQDMSCMFSLFKEQLTTFKIQSQQINNMMYVLLTKLSSMRRKCAYIKRKQL